MIQGEAPSRSTAALLGWATQALLSSQGPRHQQTRAVALILRCLLGTHITRLHGATQATGRSWYVPPASHCYVRHLL